MVRTPVAPCRGQELRPSWHQDRRVRTILSPSVGTLSRGELEVRVREAGREIPRLLHSPAPQEGRAGLARAYLPPLVSLPGGGDEALWLVRNQTISDLQHENAPSPESGGLGGVTHWAPCPARRTRRTQQPWGPTAAASALVRVRLLGCFKSLVSRHPHYTVSLNSEQGATWG